MLFTCRQFEPFVATRTAATALALAFGMCPHRMVSAGLDLTRQDLTRSVTCDIVTNALTIMVKTVPKSKNKKPANKLNAIAALLGELTGEIQDLKSRSSANSAQKL